MEVACVIRNWYLNYHEYFQDMVIVGSSAAYYAKSIFERMVLSPAVLKSALVRHREAKITCICCLHKKTRAVVKSSLLQKTLKDGAPKQQHLHALTRRDEALAVAQASRIDHFSLISCLLYSCSLYQGIVEEAPYFICHRIGHKLQALAIITESK